MSSAMRKVSLRGLAAHKVRFSLTVLSVVLGTAFIAASFVFTQMLGKSFDDIVELSTDGVAVQAPASNVNITCLAATLTASASCTINAASVTVSAGAVSVNAGATTFAGVVICTTLIATSVVSSSYTPGAGNIL